MTMHELTIYHKNRDNGCGHPGVIGIEIVPPLENREDAQTVVDILTGNIEFGGTFKNERLPHGAITRHDSEGTALLFEQRAENDPPSEVLARAIGSLIDPPGIHGIIFVDKN